MQVAFCSCTKDTDKILFLHGYLSSGKAFYNQLKFLSKDFDVYAPDLKGFGDNAGMEKPYSLDDYIEEVENYKQKHSIVCPHVIAHSFGGRIAIKAASKNPDFCNKLVLTGAAGLKPKFALNKAVKKATFNVLKKFIDKSKLSAFYSKDYNLLDSVMKESFKLIINENLDGVLNKIQTPTLLIFGKEDKETPLYMAKRYHKGLINSQLVVIKNAGHFAFIDKPHKFNREVEEFLLRN